MATVHTLKQLLLPLVVVAFASVLPKAEPEAKQGCPETCGPVPIPYPFGTREGCYLDESFLITCDTKSSTATPVAFLGRSNVTVVNISVDDGELHISAWPSHDCYNNTGGVVSAGYQAFEMPHFYLSSRRNKLYAIGCDTVALLAGSDDPKKKYTTGTGCVTICFENTTNINVDGTCGGTGCCEASVPERLSNLAWESSSVSKHTQVGGFNHCGFAFLAEESDYSFSKTDLYNFHNRSFKAVVEWAVQNKSCEEAKKEERGYSCKAEQSECVDSVNGVGYRCKCSTGFRGNPYLTHDCKDIDECQESKPCHDNGRCENLPGEFKCSCPEGYEGDGMRSNGTGCRPNHSNSGKETILIVTLCVTVGVLGLLVGGLYLYWGMRKRKLMKLRENFFQQNGGMLMQQQIAMHSGSSQTPKIFTDEELKKATDNFNESRVLGQGGYGTVYKGILQDNLVVAVKKSKICEQSQIDQFINEVIVLSQINHRNVVRLLGCCLETEVPLLVYEFITNGTLYDHLHHEALSSKLSWKVRLGIAAETAGALAYLHSATSTPVIHRDVKTTNVLLDSNLTAKVSDFGASRLVPLDQTQLTTLVQGTLGYLDPEYFQTGNLSEKSDVYSFGVVLAELLTSKKALSFDRPEIHRNISMYFVSAMKECRLLQIVDKHIANGEDVGQIMEVANLTKRCLGVKGEDRPTMKEVAMELEGLRIKESHPWGGRTVASEEADHLLHAVSDAHIGGIGDDAGTDSISQISDAQIGGIGGR